MTEAEDKLARAICREQCAFYGEPPCWSDERSNWPNPVCDEPGCQALAVAGLAALAEHEAAKAKPAAEEGKS